MLLADTVVGMALEMAIEDWTFTTDFSFRRGAMRASSEIHAVAKPMRHGRRLLVEEVDYTDDDGEMVGHAQITFMRTPLRAGETKPDIAGIRERMAGAEVPRLDAPVHELAGIEVVDAASGHFILDPHDAVRRPGGFVQGAIVTLLGEMAAQGLAEHKLGGPCVVTDLDVRYLIGGRTGPLSTTASWIGPPDRRTIRVDLVDEGHDVLSATFLARVEAPHD